MTTESECIFCRIARGEIPSKTVREDEDILAFHDVNPQAPTHILVIPRRHVASAAALGEADADLAGRLVLVAAEIARSLGLDDAGYRLVTNVGEDGGQSVAHLHVHLLGGRALGWPPG